MTSLEWPKRYLPIDFRNDGKDISVRWLDFGPKTLSEPFFNITLRRLHRLAPPPEELTTTLAELQQIAESVPEVTPAGLIFHVSRCGSTLLANALKAHDRCEVLSEARPLDRLVQLWLQEPDEEGRERYRKALAATVRLYAAAFRSSIVWKCHTSHILHLALIRKAWPETPFLILVRAPAEVVVSNLAKPSDWLRAYADPHASAYIGGEWVYQPTRISREEYCVRALATMYTEAERQVDGQCRVLDYAQLQRASVAEAARFFGLAQAAEHEQLMDQIFGTYSKDLGRSRPYEDDTATKHDAASERVLHLVERYAATPYANLRKSQVL